MEKRVVVDTSVAVKWFSKEGEGLAPQALSLLRFCRDERIKLVVPDIIIYELANALKIGKSLPQQLVLQSIKDFMDFGPQIVSVDAYWVAQGLEFMFQANLTVYDAVFVAVAEVFDIPLITEDRKHHRKSVSSRITYLDDFKL